MDGFSRFTPEDVEPLYKSTGNLWDFLARNQGKFVFIPYIIQPTRDPVLQPLNENKIEGSMVEQDLHRWGGKLLILKNDSEKANRH